MTGTTSLATARPSAVWLRGGRDEPAAPTGEVAARKGPPLLTSVDHAN